VTLDAVRPPSAVTLVDDPETVIAILSPPRLQTEDEDEIEQETAVVGEGEAAAEDSGEADSDGAGDSGSDDSGE
jgi:large subunit ribosomal protein L25